MIVLPYLEPLIVPVIEISILSVVIYYILSLFWNTRAMDLVIGVALIFTVFIFVSFLPFPVLQTLLHSLVGVALISLLVIFQPELRQALAKLSVKGKRYREISEFDRFLDSLANSVYRMAERRIGALILLENHDSLDDFASKAVVLGSRFSSELLESIFASHSPLHDGAVVIRGTDIVAAGVILPLADDSTQISRSMGTRHRAALGITQLADALSVVVSEETGRVSIARDGIMTRGVKMGQFVGIISSVFKPRALESTRKMSVPWWRRWWRRGWNAVKANGQNQ